MSNINDEDFVSETGVTNGGTTANAEVLTTDNGENVALFVDTPSGGSPGDFTLIVERYSELEERWMEFGRTSITGATEQQSFVDPAIPSRMRARVRNDTGSSADFRLNMVSY